ncbi:MAG: Nucleoside triphosphate pyrophosphohydrolase MazG [Candidatus Roizmanbacteria bacterium GW2011_GWB1_40_7]|uniref:Nucleoside triphosphate pyrophosphohydrolase MazG n=3 Tax=Candidatus Roizmaniibacteriota TaxID=1752723 RepID=A0A0G0XE54_9BACT|nr:MAG: Nucleoside triphosphate pyrophosphohydrolase MazG [Candidatus Roizmanbacteria bacterium GW2011_GWB1_40_7]KKS23149.1 MAG: Nucleoside triphosphate pyrophosphohydrolase MazG [Candidatus Roizmanbacteria bacterium GW2011_GWC2_41_7]
MKLLRDYQKEVEELTIKFNFNWSTYVEFIHLVEEVGELGEALTVHHGDRQEGDGQQALADHNDIEEEIGDILFTLLALTNQLNIDSSNSLEKAFKRYKGKIIKSQK